MNPAVAGRLSVRRFEALGLRCALHLGADDETAARAAADAAAVVWRIEAKFGLSGRDSVVRRINAAAGSGEPVSVDPETVRLLDFAAHLHRHSEGLYDLTAGAWHREGPAGSCSAPADRLPLVGWQQVRWQGEAVLLPRAGMVLDMTGLLPGYAADTVAMCLVRRGLRSGLVDIGGDLRVLGPGLGGAPWSLGIAHPRQEGESVAGVALSAGALATRGVGSAGRVPMVDGQPLDPRTGRPVRHFDSVSVVAPSCMAAGALATIALLAGPQGHEFLDCEGVPFVTVDAQGRVTERSRQVT